MSLDGVVDPHIRQMLEVFRQLSTAFAGLSLAVHFSFIPAFKGFGDCYYQMAEDFYKDYHRRLPGSLRTKRLRKKLRTKVLKWFETFLRDSKCG